MATQLLIEFEKHFPTGPVISISTVVETRPSSIIALFGPSGSGKTTLLRCLAGLEIPNRGKIQFGDETWFDGRRRIHVSPQARQIGYLSQEYHLFPHLTVHANVAYGLRSISKNEAHTRVSQFLEMMELKGLAERYPSQLSGGQKQRVALARTLATQPRLLLLDEPLSALDTRVRESLRPTLKSLLKTLDLPTLLVTHDRVDACALSDKMILLEEGQVRQEGTVNTVFKYPTTVSAARSLGVENLWKARVIRKSLQYLTVQVGTMNLNCRLKEPSEICEVGSSVTVCIRAEDVALEPTIENNPVTGRVLDIMNLGALIQITLDCQIPLVALITKNSYEKHSFSKGDLVQAFIPPPVIHLISDSSIKCS